MGHDGLSDGNNYILIKYKIYIILSLHNVSNVAEHHQSTEFVHEYPVLGRLVRQYYSAILHYR